MTSGLWLAQLFNCVSISRPCAQDASREYSAHLPCRLYTPHTQSGNADLNTDGHFNNIVLSKYSHGRDPCSHPSRNLSVNDVILCLLAGLPP